MLRAADLAHQGVNAGQRVAVDEPEVEPSAGAGGDVASQVDGRQRRVVARRMADESQTRQILDDPVPPVSRHKQDPSGYCIRSFY